MRLLFLLVLHTATMGCFAAWGDEVFVKCGPSSTGVIEVGGRKVCLMGAVETRQTATSDGSSSIGGGSGTFGLQGGYRANYARPASSAARSDMSGNLYGPRGGCYRLNSKGNKDYRKC
jgi:hypothetical protein